MESGPVGRHPFFFGPAERPLLGAMHLPERGWTGARVVLCPPLGYEGLLSYLTLQDVATQLASLTGALIFRFDYDGTGDSAGGDEDPDRVGAWVRSIHHAVDCAKAATPVEGPIILVGLRAGALLAAAAAVARSDVAGYVAWAPCPTGKAFLREQRAFSHLTLANPKTVESRGACAGLESNGFVFTEEAVSALEAMSLRTLPRPPAPDVLVLQRTELAIPNLFPATFASDAACRIEEQSTPDYQSMMDPPWLWRSPSAAISILGEWIRRATNDREAKTLPPQVSISPLTAALVREGVVERPVSFGHGRFGILTEPTSEGDRPPHAVLLVTSTFGYRIGPNRMNVALARRFGRDGFAAFRIDVRGVGDSRNAAGVSPAAPYDLGAVDDVVDAVAVLESMGYRKLTLGGVCAGAFLAWAAVERLARSNPRPIDLLLVNLEVFDPVNYNRELMAKFENPPPSAREKFRRAATWAEKAAVVGPAFFKFVKVAAGALRASSPSWALPTTLGARIERIARRGSRIDFIYSSSDQGRRQYYLQAALHHVRFHLKRIVNIEVIDGPDHSFTPRWALRLLEDAMLRGLRRGSQGATGT